MTSPWVAEVPILDGEDKAELIAEFVRVAAIYRNYSMFDVGEFVFRNLPDGRSRGLQAGSIWGNDIEIKERIRTYVSPPEGTNSTEYLIRQAKMIIEDAGAEAKDKVNAMTLIARLEGLLKKEVETVDPNKKANGLPKYLVLEQADFDQDPPAHDG